MVRRLLPKRNTPVRLARKDAAGAGAGAELAGNPEAAAGSSSSNPAEGQNTVTKKHGTK